MLMGLLYETRDIDLEILLVSNQIHRGLSDLNQSKQLSD